MFNAASATFDIAAAPCGPSPADGAQPSEPSQRAYGTKVDRTTSSQADRAYSRAGQRPAQQSGLPVAAARRVPLEAADGVRERVRGSNASIRASLETITQQITARETQTELVGRTEMHEITQPTSSASVRTWSSLHGQQSEDMLGRARRDGRTALLAQDHDLEAVYE